MTEMEDTVKQLKLDESEFLTYVAKFDRVLRG